MQCESEWVSNIIIINLIGACSQLQSFYFSEFIALEIFIFPFVVNTEKEKNEPERFVVCMRFEMRLT